MGDTPVVIGGKSKDSSAIEITGKIMLVTVLVLFFVVVFVFLLHLYARWYWNRLRQEQQESSNSTTTRRRRRRRIDFAPGFQEINVLAALRRGLDPSVLKTIPVVDFSAKDFKEGLECAVCLSELSEGDKARLLPKCNHGFHVECIDMWFQSHSTCPICRNSVSPNNPEIKLESLPMQENAGANGYSSSTEAPNFPTNVLFWGDETQVSTLGNCLEEGLNSSQQPPPASSSSSSSSSTTSTNNRSNGTLMIDIPRQIEEDEEPKSPLPRRLRSFKRLLRISPRGPTDIDLEQQGQGGVR
ncbi:hypothetical protein M9H77_00744 [Catharanthus roseus]|uniref:Uncharacterized protein n=1 Tax=Catharanthus roseus TaxID=4058 RepID=A0ACC0C3P6_CATRO|nr:hypothetical protein M9H77_00744 [Catharanthus roseus]